MADKEQDMSVENVFITGMEKCGTTALSDWMVASGLAEDRVPGEKEPNLYANDEPHPARLRTPGLPLLDASVGYASNPAAVARMPEYDTRIVLCLRNQFERAWSSYKMKKLVSFDNEQANDYCLTYQSGDGTGRIIRDQAAWLEFVHKINKKYFPRRSHHFIERYGHEELEHIRTHDFAARIEYELAFYLSRRTLPLFSVIAASLYYFPVRNLLEKYQPSDVSVISVARLADAGDRRRFVEAVFEKDVDTPEVPFAFSSADIEIEEAKPDFNDKAFDLLRASFSYDLAQARALIAKTRFGDELLDNAALDRYLEAR
jgi:hypothetical protein